MTKVRRAGFSLLEVVIATAVLLGSVIVLSHIAFVGTAHMNGAEQYSAAQLVCQTRMNEILAGARLIEEVSGEAIPELPGWGLTVKVSSAGQPGLLAIEVTAAEASVDATSSLRTESAVPTDATLDATLETTAATDAVLTSDTELSVQPAPEQTVGTGRQFTLVRWIVDPDEAELTSSSSYDEGSMMLDMPVGLPEEPSFFDTTIPAEGPSSFDDLPMPETPLPSEGMALPDDQPQIDQAPAGPPSEDRPRRRGRSPRRRGPPPEGPPPPDGLPPDKP